jgi:hypothetical protein
MNEVIADVIDDSRYSGQNQGTIETFTDIQDRLFSVRNAVHISLEVTAGNKQND